ncbi:MAG: hypothetical protein WBM40_16285, partial [Thiohalocapsa sp.]
MKQKFFAIPAIPAIAPQAASACSVVATGTATPGGAGRRTATPTSQATATSASASVLPEGLPPGRQAWQEARARQAWLPASERRRLRLP